jgi:hypothetical protein
MAPSYIIQFPEASTGGDADGGWSSAALVSVSVVVGIGVGLLIVVCIHFVREREEIARCIRCCSSFKSRKFFPRKLVFARSPDLFKHGPIDETFDYDDELEFSRKSRRYDCSNIQSHQAVVEDMEYPYTSLSKMMSTAATISNAVREYAFFETGITAYRVRRLDGSASISSISSDSDSGYDPIDQVDLMYSSSRTGLHLDFDMNDRRDCWYDCLTPSAQASSSNDTNVRSPSSVLQFSSLFSSQDMPHTDLWCKDVDNEFDGDERYEEEFMVYPPEDETRKNFYQEHGISSSITARCQSLFKGSLSFLSFSTTSNESVTESTADVCVALDDTKPLTFARTWNESATASIV